MSTNDTCKRHLKLKFRLKLWKTDGRMKWWHTTKIKRIWVILKAEKFSESYIRVTYGKGVTNSRKIQEIYNDGDYKTLEELKQALLAFTEKSLLDDTEKWIQGND